MNIEMIEKTEVVAVAESAAIALATAGGQLKELNAIEAGFAELEKRYANVVYDVTTTAGMDEAKRARLEIRTVRYAANSIGDAGVKQFNAAKKEFSATAESIKDRLHVLEDPIDAQIKVEEDRKAALKAVRDAEEQALAARIQEQINSLAFDPAVFGQTSEKILTALNEVLAIEVSLEVFGSRAGEAMQLQAQTVEQLRALHAKAAESEFQQAEMIVQRLALEAGQKLLAEQQAAAELERKRIAQITADSLAAAEAKLAAERETFRAEVAAVQKLQDDKLAAERKAEQERLDAELATKRAADAAAQKVLDDAAAVERKRLDDLAFAESLERLRLENQARLARAVAESKELRVRHEAHNLLSTLQSVLECIHTGAVIAPDQITESIERAIKQATGAVA